MVRRALRSRSLRKISVKTPGGKVAIHHKTRKPNQAHCARCGDVLKGIARGTPAKMRNMAKTKKRPERPYGGVLCSSCSRELIKEKAKSLE